MHEARSTFNGELNDFIDNVRRVHEQIIDTINLDHVTKSEWADESADKATELVGEFKAYLESHKDEIIAFTIFYNQPFQRRTVTYRMVRELLDRLKADKPAIAPVRIWHAYEQLEKVNGTSPKNELIASSIHIEQEDLDLTPFDAHGGRGKMWQLFGERMGAIIDELNEVLT